MESAALRVDVHDGGDAGLAHRRRRRGEEAADRRGHRPRTLRLDEQLRPVPAPQAQERRRAEHLALEALADLLEEAQRAPLVRPRRDDTDQVLERRIVQLTAALELLREKAADVVAGGMDDRARIRLERLDEHPARGVTTAP